MLLKHAMIRTTSERKHTIRGLLTVPEIVSMTIMIWNVTAGMALKQKLRPYTLFTSWRQRETGPGVAPTSSDTSFNKATLSDPS